MTDKVPFGGVYGWLGDLTSQKAEHQSYYVAEPAMHRAMTAIRAHAGVSKDAIVTLRRALSKQEVTRLGLKPGQVKAAT